MSIQDLSINAQGVSQHFGPIKAVDEVTLTIPTGQVLSLLGPNGAGKTTFLDMVLGFTTPVTGTLEVLGTSPRQAVQQGRVGAVLQSGAMLNDLTVRATVEYVARCHRRHVPLEPLLDRVNLTSLAGRKVKALSGGERQRLRFALALLPDPELIILDEPTAGMDVRARATFWETMRQEAGQGRTIIFATHYLEEAANFADRIVVITKGKIHTDGTARELTEAAPRTVTATWLGPVAPEEFAARMGAQLTGHGPDGQVNFDVTGNSDPVVLALLNERIARDVEVHRATLDRIFLDITKESDTEGVHS